MLISEVAVRPNQLSQLMALAEFVRQRAQDTASEPSISANAFVRLADSMGIPITKRQLKDLMTRPPLNNIIVDMTGSDDESDPGRILFRGSQEEPEQTDTMTPDMARMTVDTMAKRAVKKDS